LKAEGGVLVYAIKAEKRKGEGSFREKELFLRTDFPIAIEENQSIVSSSFFSGGKAKKTTEKRIDLDGIRFKGG